MPHLFSEGMNHTRTRLDTLTTLTFYQLAEHAVAGELLAGVDPVGDTMFNRPQLAVVDAELQSIARRHPDLAGGVAQIRALIEEILRNRGYLWASGD